ncbi:SlyX family protein [sulfur-oxidizing endosymbiont of Gigantopelta aegis]|uniref:SlyX family protein n=1 Tax=sulfur-oxidizing endosymbiont of Gigantopelta aegis TaxID=2794934 RepID=UPI0018DCDC25|nr:SlyX family protein [sulfur-oxidizing endosymbiont of Gigantopelta aegis]
MSDIENRIMELEIKNSHQEDTIEQLNQIIIKHDNIVTNLAKQMEQLQNKLSTMQTDNSKDEPETPPPHY